MKKYYTERELNSMHKIGLPTLKSYFLRVYKQLYEEEYFEKAERIWGHDAEFFVFRKLGMWGILPIEQNIAKYEEATLFSVIEFLYSYVSRKYFAGINEFTFPVDTYEYDKETGQRIYRNIINDILRFYNGGYKLSEHGEILKLSPPGFESLIEGIIETNDPENIDSRVKYAISKFSRYSSSVEEKKDAVRTLGDVLEYLGKFGIKLDNKDDSDLFKIINGFDIRHHNREQQSDYNKDLWYDWMFYTFLASIYVLLKLNDKKFGLKTQ